ncbi:MAG: MFS transporter [Halieaceae bacterium]|nr:MFS transporter [Halieaceae bacterium]
MTIKTAGFKTQLTYGFGAVAYGIKDNGFGYFLLLFYGTVVGLEPGLVGTAIFIALIFDAISDPIIGYWSDNTRSRWGRRHPFMYAAALPVAVSYWLLWNPPEWGQAGLFAYLLGLAVLIRTFITLYETPSSALMPELSTDYAERTTIQAWRQFFGWTGGNFMSVLMFGLLLVPTAQYSVGTLNREGYQTYGVISSILIFIAILVSALGTHSQIPELKKPPKRDSRGLKAIFKELFQTLAERSFLALFAASLFGAMATGLAGAMSYILLTYFWGFSSYQIFIYTSLVFLSAGIGLGVAPWFVKRWGKKAAAIRLGALAFSVAPAPVLLRLLGLMPDNGDPMLFPLLAVINTIDLGLIIACQAVLYSMVADLVEQNELRTGKRSEGVFFAAITFIRKTNQGLGAFAAGIILSLIAFPQGASPDQVSAETIRSLGLWHAPTLLVLWSLMLFCISRYQLSKDDHEANLQKLATRS